MQTGTLQELNVQPGDVVEFVEGCPSGSTCPGDKLVCSERHGIFFVKHNVNGIPCAFTKASHHTFRIISRAPRDETPKLWRDMTAEEKGALLLAAHEGEVLEQHQGSFGWQERVDIPMWQGNNAYRVKPDDVRETAKFKWWVEDDISGFKTSATYQISIDLINGEPYPASIRMERL